MCEGEDAFSAMYSKCLHFAVDSAWQSYSFDSKFDSVSFEVVTGIQNTYILLSIQHGSPIHLIQNLTASVLK